MAKKTDIRILHVEGDSRPVEGVHQGNGGGIVPVQNRRPAKVFNAFYLLNQILGLGFIA
ncbi:hypothetical protein D3C75_644010 [compost metagenome]